MSDQPVNQSQVKDDDAARRNLSRRKIIFIAAGFCVLAGILFRLMLPTLARDYVNRIFDRSPLYNGRIGDLSINLWRGEYSIKDVRFTKVAGQVPLPLFQAPSVSFAIQWKALLRGKIVGRVDMEKPEINFVDGTATSGDQTGAGGEWLGVISDLFPFQIDSALIQDGSFHFRSFKGGTPVDVYLSEVHATIENLTNVRDETRPLCATVKASGLAMSQAKFELNMMLDPTSYHPTFHLAFRLLGLEVASLNDLARTYGGFDFERGWVDLVVEVQVNDGQLSGYVKPLFRNLQVFSVKNDVGDENIFDSFWQVIVGGVISLSRQTCVNYQELRFFSSIAKRSRPSASAVGNARPTGVSRKTECYRLSALRRNLHS